MALTIPESSGEVFFQRLKRLENALTAKNTLIDDSLEVVKKGGFKWVILCLLRPFYALFCLDPYLHYRVNKVVTSLIQYCALNHKYIENECNRSLLSFRRIVALLEQKTAGKYVASTISSVVRFANSEWGLCAEKPANEKPCHIVLPLHSGSKLLWPTALESFGLTNQTAVIHDRHINDLLARQKSKGGELKLLPGRMELWKAGRLIQGYDFPFSFVRNPKTGNLIILTNSVLKKGGEREVYLGFDLISGEFLVKKEVVGAYETNILAKLDEERAKRGIHLTYFTQRQEDGKEYIIESLCQGTFPSLFDPAKSLKLKERLLVMIDLLEDLVALHKQRYITDPSFRSSGGLPTYGSFHLDIKPLNILVTNEGRMVFCDLGRASGNLGGLVSSPGYTPPEYVKFHVRNFPEGFKPTEANKKRILEFNENNAQRRDMWAMGLIMLTLLIEDTVDKAQIAPLKCLREKLKGAVYGEENIQSLSQSEIDKELADTLAMLLEKDPFYAKTYKTLIHDIIQNILIVDAPAIRLEAEKALELLRTCLGEMEK